MIGLAGFGTVLHVVGRLGATGFLIYCGYSLLTVLLLGFAWACAAPPLELRRMVVPFGWARLVREAASDILPFSQVGGLIIGIRMLIARGISGPLINAAVMVDLTTEMAAQIVFTLFGLSGFIILRSGATHSGALLTPILIGTSVMIVLMVAFFAAQRWMVRFAGLLLRRMLPSAGDRIGDVGAELTRIYQQRRRVAAALLSHLGAWLLSAAGAWLALMLMGVRLPLINVLVIESLIFVLRSVAFAIPGAIGVQEAAYAMLGPLLGLPPASALALSLAKRARDLSIGVPALVAWQLGEARAVRRMARFRRQGLGHALSSAHNDRQNTAAGEER